MTDHVPHRLSAYALFAALLSAAGLPLYIHAPKFYVDEYGVSLGALALVLFGLRLLDVVQDPLFGKLSEVYRNQRAQMVLLAGIVMALSMVGLFAVTPPVAPLIWFTLMLTGVFSGFSFLTINFYAQGVTKAGALGPNGHLRLARWRETGALIGVCLAAVAPTVLAGVVEAPFVFFAVGFALVAGVAVLVMQTEWVQTGVPPAPDLRAVVSDGLARRLLLLAFINAAPVAVSSTLFLFYVESRLDAPGSEGPLLLLFFLAAAVCAPLWGHVAQRIGAKATLIWAMALSIAAFGFAAFLGPGDVVLFALVCAASGAALGADLTLLPAVFAARMARISPSAAQAFGLWSFVSKFTLAFAAVTLLPILEAAGFQSGAQTNSDDALLLLALLYAVLPCILKLAAIALLAATDLKEI